MSVGFAELVVDELLKFVNAVVRTGACPECKGEGGHDPDVTPGAPVVCPRCDGTGNAVDPVAGITVAELEYDRGAMVVRARALFANYQRQRSATSNSRNFFIRDTSARFAQPIYLEATISREPCTIYPDSKECIAKAVELADDLAEQGFFE